MRGCLPYMVLLYFLDQRVLRRITKSPFSLTHKSSRVSSTVHAHHLPLELWYTLWGEHGDMLSWPPFKDSLSSCWKCCQWASLNHQPLREQPMCTTHPGGGMTAWPVDVSGQPPESPHHSRPGQLRSSGQCSSVLSHFIPPDSTVLTPRAPLIHIPTLNSIWVCIQENQPATHIRKHSSTQGGYLFENYWLHTYL